jgi:hypothetical protein
MDFGMDAVAVDRSESFFDYTTGRHLQRSAHAGPLVALARLAVEVRRVRVKH